MTHRHRISVILAAGLLMLLSGCSAEDAGPGIDMIPVSGTVIMDGQPLAGVTVMFNPVSETRGNGGFAITDGEGKFSLTDYHANPGCPPGEYGVTFSKITQPDGSPIPPGAQRGEIGMVEQIPPAYNLFKPNSVIQGATVQGPEATFAFQLDSKFKPPRSFFAE